MEEVGDGRGEEKIGTHGSVEAPTPGAVAESICICFPKIFFHFFP